jgi:hypothetical protein
MRLKLCGSVVLMAIVGSGFVGQDELTEALRHFGERKLIAALMQISIYPTDLILMAGLHVTEEQLASMIARTDTTGRGTLHSCLLLFFCNQLTCASLRRDQYG